MRIKTIDRTCNVSRRIKFGANKESVGISKKQYSKSILKLYAFVLPAFVVMSYVLKRFLSK